MFAIDVAILENAQLCTPYKIFNFKNDIITHFIRTYMIQIWHLGECNINCYCTLKNDIARGACASCNIIFQSAIKINIARKQSAMLVLLYAYCSFKLNNLLI